MATEQIPGAQVVVTDGVQARTEQVPGAQIVLGEVGSSGGAAAALFLAAAT
jgi:hypothetical protein